MSGSTVAAIFEDDCGSTGRPFRDLVEATGTAVDPTAPPRDELLAIFLNPSPGRLNLRLGVGAPSELSLELFDLRGRRIFAAPGRFYAAGEHLIDLDLPVASGTYVLRVALSEGDALLAEQLSADPSVTTPLHRSSGFCCGSAVS